MNLRAKGISSLPGRMTAGCINIAKRWNVNRIAHIFKYGKNGATTQNICPERTIEKADGLDIKKLPNIHELQLVDIGLPIHTKRCEKGISFFMRFCFLVVSKKVIWKWLALGSSDD